jgi:hypothetical protein
MTLIFSIQDLKPEAQHAVVQTATGRLCALLPVNVEMVHAEPVSFCSTPLYSDIKEHYCSHIVRGDLGRNLHTLEQAMHALHRNSLNAVDVMKPRSQWPGSRHEHGLVHLQHDTPPFCSQPVRSCDQFIPSMAPGERA